MAAVSIWTPSNLTGYRIEDRILLVWSPFTGAGSLAEIKVTVYSDSGGTTEVWSSGFVAPDSVRYGSQWAEIWPDTIGLAASTNYWIGVNTRNDSQVADGESTLIKITTETARVSSARQLAAM